MLFGKKRVSENPVVSLARCIAFCDDLRAYRRGDLAQIDETFDSLKKTRFREYSDMWSRVRPAAEKIVNMPLSVPGARIMIGAVNWTRVGGRLALIAMIVLIALQIVPIWQNVLGPDPFGGRALLYTLIIVLVAAMLLAASSLFDYVIRKRIIQYEDATVNDYAQYRQKMKECVNKMMASFAREAGRGSETPESLRMVLNFGDYDHIEVVSKWQPRSMWLVKRTYEHYLVYPRA